MDSAVVQQVWDNALMVKIALGAFTVAASLIAIIHSRHEKRTEKNSEAIAAIRDDLNEHFIRKDAFTEYKIERKERDKKLDEQLDKIGNAAVAAANTAQALYNVVEKRGDRGVHKHD